MYSANRYLLIIWLLQSFTLFKTNGNFWTCCPNRNRELWSPSNVCIIAKTHALSQPPLEGSTIESLIVVKHRSVMSVLKTRLVSLLASAIIPALNLFSSHPSQYHCDQVQDLRSSLQTHLDRLCLAPVMDWLYSVGFQSRPPSPKHCLSHRLDRHLGNHHHYWSVDFGSLLWSTESAAR